MIVTFFWRSALVKASGVYMLVNSIDPGLNFINVLSTAFTCADPKSVKKTVKLSIFFTLFGSMS